MIPFDLIVRNITPVTLEKLHFSKENASQIHQIVAEHKHLDVLKNYNLKVANKILLHGHSGCGKTSTAIAIATTLKKPIIITELSHLISSKIGETSKQVKSLFDKANREKSVLFLDEFDLVGKARSTDDNDVGEMRRLVNTIIQLMDYLADDAILIAASNFYDLIDTALLRRFELKLSYQLPTNLELDTYYDEQLLRFPNQFRMIDRKYECSYAEAKDYLELIVKRNIIQALDA